RPRYGPVVLSRSHARRQTTPLSPRGFVLRAPDEGAPSAKRPFGGCCVMPTALVTGPIDERLSDMSIALKSGGFDVVTAAADACPIAGEVSSVDCYVQLPHEPPPHGGDALSWAREV